MANIKDIAKLANVSKSTVSRVVANNGFVKLETRKRIENVMKELNYRPNMFAKGMRTNKSQSIGILFPDLANPFFSEWYEVVDQLAREKGYLNYICISDPQGKTEESRIDDLLARSIDGIILFSYNKKEALLKRLEFIGKTTPIVCCDAMFKEYELNCVYADGKKATKSAVEYLYNSGRRRIAYIRGPKNLEVINNRYTGYLEALDELKLNFNESLVVEGDFTKESGWLAASELMKQNERPDAIMVSTDYMAMGVLDFLAKNNYNIPTDIAVFGFDNLKTSETTNPPLSTIALPIQELAKTTIRCLIDLIEKPVSSPKKYKFECELMIRKST